MTSSEQDLQRITEALERTGALLSEMYERDLDVEFKQGDDPVTEADRAADALLKEILFRAGDGWLSEETADDLEKRIGHERVWIVDPLDGTREFVTRIPEWCVSIGLVENGRPVAGGIHNPATGELVVGSVEGGVVLNGEPVVPRACPDLASAEVRASNSEVNRGEWDHFADEPFTVVSTGSVAYKLGLVAAGLTDATWTFTPKNEWDVAGGAALVVAAGGTVRTLGGEEARFNNRDPLLPGFVAFSPASAPLFLPWFETRWRR
jgi:myo-inositol-1(or 4)-monophosphatase